MVDTTFADSVRAALRPALQPAATQPKHESSDRDGLRDSELIEVPYSLATLVDWNDYLFRRLMDEGPRQGFLISSTGVNARLDRVEIALPNADARARAEVWLATQNTPCGLVVTKIEGAASVQPGVGTTRR
jgi:hypothetical protein